MSKTTILIETDTRQLLRRIGRKEQTYDALIKELVVKCEKCEENEGLPGRRIETSAAKQASIVDESEGATLQNEQ